MNCSILDFGARECDRLQTAQIQAAIDACYLAGGGEVRIPAGVFRAGSVRLRSRVTLYLESGAILTGSDDPEDYMGFLQDELEPVDLKELSGEEPSVYPYSRWNNGLIRAFHAEDVAIIGEKGSYIDGVNCYDGQGEEGYRGPHGVNMHFCRNIRLEGYTLKDCGNWAHALFNCAGIAARGLTVLGGHDGFDVRTCDDVTIEDCRFITGDDCVAGFDNNDVTVRRCLFDTACSALRFGGNHVLVEDCQGVAPASFGHRLDLSDEKKRTGRMTDGTCRHNMLNAFLYYCDHRADPRRAPGDIVIRNCRFREVDRLFSLEFDGNHIWCCNRSLTGIRFENCTAEGLEQPILICGDEKEPICFELENVELSAKAGFGNEAVADAKNYSAIRFSGTKLLGYQSPWLKLHTQGAVEIKNSTRIRM